MTNRLAVLVLAAAGILAAQDPPSRAGRISLVTGAVSFQPAGVDQWAPATVNRPLTIGDQLFSDNGGRAEVHVTGSAFRLGDRTAFEFMNLDDQIVQVRLSEGVLDLRVRKLYGTVEVDAPNLAFTVSRPGEYRIDTNPDSLESLITVRDGEGQVTSAGGGFVVHAGQQAVITGQDQAAQYQVNPAPGMDGFDNWVVSRNQREDRYAQPRYVSSEMVGYEDLGEYGAWRSNPEYGQMWVPNNVAAGWAPYQDGHWAWVDPWGWTWVDDAPWGFAPFHYGRWAFVNGYWGWCPGPVRVAPVYAPAMVAWLNFGSGFGVSLGFGSGPSVGWFPLGPRDVYIPAYGASQRYVTRVNVTNTTIIKTTNVTNVYNTYVRTGSVPVNTYMNRNVAGAVVAAPQNVMATAQPVRQVFRRVQPNQLTTVKSVIAAPRVAPQVASVLGRAPVANAPRPSATVLSRQVVARATPPPPPPSFQQRQTLLAKNPGRPVPVAELHQLARATPPPAAARPQVKVVNQARPITPRVATSRPPAAAIPPAANQPQRTPGQPQAAGPAQRPGTVAQPQKPGVQAPSNPPQRTFQPPTAQGQRPGTVAPTQRPSVPQSTPPQRTPAQRTPVNPQRKFEPPTAQGQRPGTVAPTQRPGMPQSAQPQRTPANLPRTVEPPNGQAQRPGAATPPQRTPVPQRQATPPTTPSQRTPATPQRTVEPPARQPQQRPGTSVTEQRTPAPRQASPTVQPRGTASRTQTEPSRPGNPPAARAPQTARPQPRVEQPRAQPRQAPPQPRAQELRSQPPRQTPPSERPHAQPPQAHPAAPAHPPERKQEPHA